MIEAAEIAEVVATLRSGWLTGGAKTIAFEERFAAYVGTRHAVGVTSGTAAVELALEIAGIGCGDEVITTPLTFVATGHAILKRRAVPIFADVDPTSFNLDPQAVAACIGPRTRAVLAMHFAGRPCAMPCLERLASRHGLLLISDAAHAIEAHAAGRPLATWSCVSAYSFHPTKNLTTGEGGMIATDDAAWADRARQLRLHGLSREAWDRSRGGASAPLDVEMLGHKFLMSDLQASLGLHQLAALERRHAHRACLVAIYDRGFAGLEGLQPPESLPHPDRHAHHLYTVLLDPQIAGLDRQTFCAALHGERIGTAHHYPALHQTSYYRDRFGWRREDCPNAATISERIVTLPLFAGMTEADAHSVVAAVRRVLRRKP
jgi:dTDP-4-amino-4,6-dideoxygalactose transaminase